MKVLHDLNEREKAGLLYRHFHNEKSYRTAFLIAHPDKTGNENGFLQTVSRWKNSPAVQNFVTEIDAKEQTRLNALLQLQRKRTQNGNQDSDSEPGKETFTPNWHNFTDLNEFLSFCELQANTIQDEKDRKDYLKMIADLMQYKNQDKSVTDIQRFYTPLQCVSCPLYLAEK